MPLNEHLYCVAVALKMTERVEQWICIRFCIMFEHSSVETIQMIQKVTVMGNWWLAASSQQCVCSCITSGAEFFGKTSNHPGVWAFLQPSLAPCDFQLFQKLKSPLKGKRFQNIDEIQEYTTGQVMAIGRTVWGPKVPTLKGTEASLSYVQCFLSLGSSSINVSVFHITWLDTFWKVHMCVCVCLCLCVCIYLTTRWGGLPFSNSIISICKIFSCGTAEMIKWDI